MNLFSKKRRGFTLTESAIVLGVAGVVLGAIWAVASTVWNNYSKSKAIQQATTVAQNVRDYYEPRGGVIPASITTDELFPSEVIVSSGNYKHGLGGALTASRTDDPVAGPLINITLSGLSKENCIQIIMQMPVRMNEIGIYSIGKVGTTLPITDARAQNLTYINTNWCNLSGRTNAVFIQFKLRN